MGSKKILLLICLCFGNVSNAFVLAEVEMALILTENLKTTLQLLEVAKKTQDSLGKFHNSLSRKYYLSQRIVARLESIKRLKNMKPKTWREVNYAIYSVKSNWKSIKHLYHQAGVELEITGKELGIIEVKKMGADVNNKLLELRENKSITGRTILDNTSNAAINTAQSNVLLNNINKNVLQGNKYQIMSYQKEISQLEKELRDEAAMRKMANMDEFTRKIEKRKGRKL